MIRHAKVDDASRIAEILIFTKRMNYRKIFHNDRVSFGEMQVYPLAKEYIDTPDKLENIWVYDDEFVKGMIHIDGTQIYERHGFVLTGDKQLQEGITEFIVLMKL